ncbi:30S ribosomal protein S7 [Candidatus Woesearchaeota archaeon]|jgi:small subunit ribosomal protein S7|nr:30S ribosomal protein S7 [Candidatus Woesearchaeota archaeon]MBT5397546.1 30S ribosomal protein S7 [Candidatus Woesearchaeota archaeon]MBT5924772.1 30S ribosomal protein S7 [Candidatus Woesearchaeota archaeon]MBT6367881.1 30S ribosomal protein S7 [Candidatus Woesearchaeota archaeon]MBT7763106.1 30S ribosomal protein S7 [Candidatus Woesearchaeota archaeon]
MSDIKFFNRWSAEGVTVVDAGLQKYMTLAPKIVPKTGARYAGNRFHKSHTFIVERLASKLMSSGHKGKKHFMSSGHNTGKKSKVLKVVENALAKAEIKLKQNPLTILVKAIENAAPREEVIAIEYGGARYPKAVDVAPQRRIDIALRYMVQGAYVKSFNKKMKIETALAEEIINAYGSSARSNAVAKKRDLERQAASSK